MRTCDEHRLFVNCARHAGLIARELSAQADRNVE
jgi:hypothetical protein